MLCTRKAMRRNRVRILLGWRIGTSCRRSGSHGHGGNLGETLRCARPCILWGQWLGLVREKAQAMTPRWHVTRWLGRIGQTRQTCQAFRVFATLAATSPRRQSTPFTVLHCRHARDRLCLAASDFGYPRFQFPGSGCCRGL